MKRRSTDDLVAILRDLGVAPGDRLMVHSFLPAVGLVDGGLTGFELALREAVGSEGTLIVPTFTYSFRRGEVFDPANSPSTVGVLTEHLRKQVDAVRSPCPLFSMAAIGADSRYLMERRSPRCFGKDSVFKSLFSAGVKIAGLGVDWDHGYTFFMHLERLAQVPFRADRIFAGQTRQKDGSLVDDEAVHFVRRDDVVWKRNRGPFCRQLVAEGRVQETVHDGCPFRLFDSRLVAPRTLDALREDPWCMAMAAE